MGDIRVHTTVCVIPLSLQAHDWWKLHNPCIELVWPEHLGPTATLVARRSGRMIEEHPDDIDIARVEFVVGVGAQPNTAAVVDRPNRFEVVDIAPSNRLWACLPSPCRFRAVACCTPASAVGPCRSAWLRSWWRPVRRCPLRLSERRSAGCQNTGRLWPWLGVVRLPDRVWPEVGSGRSCAWVVGGDTPLQVPLWGTFASLGGQSRGRRISDSMLSRSGLSCG